MKSFVGNTEPGGVTEQGGEAQLVREEGGCFGVERGRSEEG
jgi:hypothetical protein